MNRRKYTREDLNEKQRLFVDGYIEAGGNRLAATRLVEEIWGYDSKTSSVKATQLLKMEKIRDVLHNETYASFAALAVVANERLSDILLTGMWFGQKVKPSDGMRAIREAMDRAGLAVVHQHHLEITDGRTPKELRGEIANMLSEMPEADRREFAKSLGYDPGEVIDATFEELQEVVSVDPAAPFGYKVDGTPRKKPGGPRPSKDAEKRILPGPDAYKPEPEKPEYVKVRERMKKKKLLAAKNAAWEKLQQEEAVDGE